jgi:hypothetical protein
MSEHVKIVNLQAMIPGTLVFILSLKYKILKQ